MQAGSRGQLKSTSIGSSGSAWMQREMNKLEDYGSQVRRPGRFGRGVAGKSAWFQACFLMKHAWNHAGLPRMPEERALCGGWEVAGVCGWFMRMTGIG